MRLTLEGERFCIEGRVGTEPEDGAVWLTGIEAAEVSASTAAAATSEASSTTAEAAASETAAASKARPAESASATTGATEEATCAGKLLAGIGRQVCGNGVANLIEVDAGERAHLS